MFGSSPLFRSFRSAGAASSAFAQSASPGVFIVLRRLLWAVLCMACAGAHGFSVSNGRIYDETGTPVMLRGVNWFGFETSNYVVHGLWARGMEDMLDQMKA